MKDIGMAFIGTFVMGTPAKHVMVLPANMSTRTAKSRG